MAAAIAEILGIDLMPWQRHVLDVALEYDPATLRLQYREVVLVVPRQSGKTILLLVLMVHRALGFGDAQRVAYTAQTAKDALAKWEDDHVPMVRRSRLGRSCRVRKANGRQAILWDNGSTHGLMASTEKSGHGPTLDLGVIDEAFAQADARLEQAYKPSMITRKNAQMWTVSTAGASPIKSPFLWDKVEAGRIRCDEGTPTRVAFFEWSAPDDAPRGSHDTWRSCMPALGHTIDIEDVQADFDSMPVAEFDRAYLNRWNPRTHESVIPEDDWEAGRDPEMRLLDPVAFGIDTTPDRAWTAIAAAGEVRPSRIGVELVAHDRGLGWVVAAAVELDAAHHPRCWVIDPLGPAGSLIEPLREAGLNVLEAGTADHRIAVGSFYDDATTELAIGDLLVRRLAHLGQPELDAAVAGASRRNVGDAWLWGRRQSSVNIAPLVAATLARWGFTRPVEPERRKSSDFVTI